MTDRLVSGNAGGDDVSLDLSLRPQRLDYFVGQQKVKENLSIALQAAKIRDEPLDHVMLYGPPGLGKTTLAQIIAREMEVNIRVSSGPAIERPGDMAAILTSLSLNDILFVDEVHRLGRVVEEVLYPAMEDYNLSWVMGKGLAARNINLKVNKFTFIGATTRYAMVSAPLRDRFGIIHRLDFYDQEAMEIIVDRSAQILDVKVETEALIVVAKRSRGTPRVANRLLRRVRDYALVKANGVITKDIAVEALGKLEVDELGLDQIDHRLLSSMIDKFAGGPVGLDTLAASISEEPDTVMDVCEPYLLQLGFLDRTPRGRVVTALGYNHLGRDPVDSNQLPQGKMF